MKQKFHRLSLSHSLSKISFAIQEMSFFDGSRAAFASTFILFIGILLGRHDFAWAAIGAFWTCLAETSGTSRERLASMLLFSIVSTVCGGITAYAAGIGVLASAITIFAFSTLAGLTRIWGSASYQVAILAATTCVVMVDSPIHDVNKASTLLGIYLSGCLFATAFNMIVWLCRYYSPSKHALRLTYFRLSELAEDSARLLRSNVNDIQMWAIHTSKSRTRTRNAIEKLRQTLNSLPKYSSKNGEQINKNLYLGLADAERAFASLIAIAYLKEEATSSITDPKRTARCLLTIAIILKKIGQQIDTRNHIYPDLLRERLRRASQHLEVSLRKTLVLPFFALERSEDDISKVKLNWCNAVIEILRSSIQILRYQLAFSSLNVQFALRLGTTVTIVFLIVRILQLPFGYWATMATLLIIQPSLGTTWVRSIERATGSILGAILAIAIGYVIHTPLIISIIVFPLIYLAVALRSVKYSLFVVFLTPSFVLVADYALPSSELFYSIARLGNNILGSVVAVFATYLLWPNRESQNLYAAQVEAIRANLVYLSIALKQNFPQENKLCASARRQAGLASNRVENIYSLSKLESKRKKQELLKISNILSLLRTIAGTAAKLQARNTTTKTKIEITIWVDEIINNLNSYLCGQSTLPSSPPLFTADLDIIEVTAITQIHKLFVLIDFSKTND